MKRRVLLKKVMTMARTGDTENFENFYILTVDETYGKIASLIREPAQAEALLTDVYVSLYHQVHTLPVEEEELIARLEEEIYREAEKRISLDLEKRVDFPGSFDKLNDERAATLWMQIDERIGTDGEEKEEEWSWKACLRLAGRIAAAAGALVITAVIVYQGWHYLQFTGTEEETVLSKEQETEEIPVDARKQDTLVIEKEKLAPGWQQKEDSKLYYVKKDGTPADGQVAIGKQLLTFSRDGELMMIDDNREVVQNGNLSFDEETRYEVKNGDVYRTSEDGRELSVIRNGHVVQADVRCGYLWYLCQYRIPNSEQIKTTLCRAHPDGEEQEEIYSTGTILETSDFQVTEDWYYYLSDGKLFRKSLENGKTEFLADDVAHYFAWGGTAYYMKDRTLETVSRGMVYSGMEAGYQIERTGAGFVLLDESGNSIPQSGNGEIQVGDRKYQIENGTIRSVAPAVRKDGTNIYYIDESSSDRKIYWKSKDGTRGMIPQEGLSADSICIAGEWLYYSARTAQYGAEVQSQICRINLRTSQTERVGSPFRGIMRNLYYFDNVQTIYGEYISSVVDPEDIHGTIARISVEKMGVVNDMAARPESEKSDMLELVMASENRIYCLYHRCTYDAASGKLIWTSTEPLEIALP